MFSLSSTLAVFLFSDSIPIEITQNAFTVTESMLRRKENFYYLALPRRNCFIWGNKTGNTGSNAPSCPLGYPIRTQNSPHLARSWSLAVCITMFWARLRLILARGVRRGLNRVLRRAQNWGPQFFGRTWGTLKGKKKGWEF